MANINVKKGTATMQNSRAATPRLSSFFITEHHVFDLYVMMGRPYLPSRNAFRGHCPLLEKVNKKRKDF
jgi:hypothetical protein